MWWTKWKSKYRTRTEMPSRDRPKRHSVKALTKSEKAERDAKLNAEREKARRASHAAAATKKRTVKVTVDDLSDRFSKMKIHDGGRRYRATRRKDRRRRRYTRKA